MCSTPRSPEKNRVRNFSPRYQKDAVLFWVHLFFILVQSNTNRPYHQVKISHWSNHEGENFVQRNIFRKFIQTKIFIHSESLSSKFLWYQTGISRQYPQRIKSKSQWEFSIHSPSTKKYCPRHWELSLDALNLPIVQRLYKVLWKAQITRSCFAFWAARYDCASKAYIFTQLPPPQDLTTASNTFPQLFKIPFQFIIQKLEGQKLVHWEIKPWSKEEQKSGFW